MRRLIEFPCAGDMLVGSLDEAEGATGLLIVSGGNEIRAGAHRGMASLAARLASAGIPVFRFDRRGVGDSSGENRGFAESAPDIAAAAATFCAEARISRLVGFGNCDAATALALFRQASGIDALILANPWIADQTDDLPSASAIKARYAQRLRDPREWLRALRGGVNFASLTRGLRKIIDSKSEPTIELATRLFASLAIDRSAITILLAARDNTAIGFRAAWEAATRDASLDHVRIVNRDSASHSFASGEDKDWLFEQVTAALARAAG
ncbi:MAG: hydrolase 1, exosortase A system-associated [Sphingomonas sp.]|jgi:exosortase A-associated hydrolase 1|uniref:hydrolase 1, exosortase A system-associated n=1 Tax=Sphingomonas sp. TaxID=28214 RepID=UPI0035645C1A